MIIRLDSYGNHFKENKSYNDSVRHVVSDLFQTHTMGRIPYALSEESIFIANDRFQYFTGTEDKKEYLKPHNSDQYKDFLKYQGQLGPLEYSLAHYLLNNDLDYNVVIMTGALGSGKSTISNYVLDFIRNSQFPPNNALHFPSTGKIYKINFNDGFAGATKEEIGYEFKRLLVDQVLAIIEGIHRQILFIDSFIAKIRLKEDARFNSFSEYERKVSNQNLSTEEKKFEYLLDFLENESSLPWKLRLTSYLLAFILENTEREKNNDFIILLDNIDRFYDDSQMELLNIIFSFSVKLPIKILVPMRLTTFGKVQGNGSYSFAVFENRGQRPSTILAARLKHFLDNQNNYNTKERLSEEVAARLVSKIQFVYDCITNKVHASRLSNFFSSIAGHSIRRGLFLSERFLLNSAVRYNDDNVVQDDLLRSLLISENESCKFSTNDAIVNNIFCSLAAGGDFSLINIRILQILNFFRENQRACKMNILLGQLGLFEEYTTAEILDSINDLINYRRRLVYIEGVNDYSDVNNLYQSMSDVVHITYSGVEYISTLLNDIVYLQHSFITLNWKIPKSMRSLRYIEKHVENMNNHRANPNVNFLTNLINHKTASITDFILPAIDFSNVNERMQLIRECLNFLLVNDVNQLSIYHENNEINFADQSENRYIKDSIIIDVIAKVSINVLNILRNNPFSKNELGNWYDLLIISDLWQSSVFQTPQISLQKSINFYKIEMPKFM